MVGIGSGAILGPKGTMLHLVDPGHFLEDHLALLDKFTHGGNYCLVTRHIPAKNEGKFQDVTILSCTPRVFSSEMFASVPQRSDALRSSLRRESACRKVSFSAPDALSIGRWSDRDSLLPPASCD
jgi:hypothetical protein